MILTLKDIRTQHPFPWSSKTDQGIITVCDAKGASVGLLTLVEFAKLVTAALNK